MKKTEITIPKYYDKDRGELVFVLPSGFDGAKIVVYEDHTGTLSAQYLKPEAEQRLEESVAQGDTG